MDVESTLMILRQTVASATIQDALAFLSICEDRGLSPFVEASPLIQDYTKSNGQKVHSLAIKEHYAVQERWAQQCGGYILYKSEVEKTSDGIIARVWVIANRDYAAVGKLAAMIPTLDFKEELARFTVCGEATVTQSEMNRKAPTTKTWEWVATKRAREGALRQKFGKEPSQARQMYTAALTALSQSDLREGIAAMYPQRQALAVAAEPIGAPVIEIITGEVAQEDAAVEPETQAELHTQSAPDEPPDAWDEEEADNVAPETDEAFIDIAEVGVFTSKTGKPHLGLMEAGHKWPDIRWWDGRDKLLQAAPWLAQAATKEQLAVMDARYPFKARVYYEPDGDFKKAVRFERVA